MVGGFGPEALNFVKDLGRHLIQVRGEPASRQYLLQGLNATQPAVLGLMLRLGNQENIWLTKFKFSV